MDMVGDFLKVHTVIKLTATLLIQTAALLHIRMWIHSPLSNICGAWAVTTIVRTFDHKAHFNDPALLADIQDNRNVGKLETVTISKLLFMIQKTPFSIQK